VVRATNGCGGGGYLRHTVVENGVATVDTAVIPILVAGGGGGLSGWMCGRSAGDSGACPMMQVQTSPAMIAVQRWQRFQSMMLVSI
jgi:hypothetical protein